MSSIKFNLAQRYKEIALKSVANGQARAYQVANNVIAYIVDHDKDLNPLTRAEFLKNAFADVNHPARSYTGLATQVPGNPKDEQIDQLITAFPLNL